MTDTIPAERTTRAERNARPRLSDVIKAVAEEHGACTRPVQLRKTNLDTGLAEQVLIRAGPHWRRCARPAPSGPRSCARASAGKAGTSKRSRYVDPATGELLPSWDEALDAIGPNDQPVHVARLGREFKGEGVLAGSKDSARCIGYLTKYLVKDLGTCHVPDTDAQRAHVDRLVRALRFEPCSPTCANWLRYGITPKNPRQGLVPGYVAGPAT